MTKKNIFILLTLILLFASCSLGKDDGSDLVGLWSLHIFGAPVTVYTFNTDYTGILLVYKYLSNEIDYNYTFTWNIEKSGINNKVVINYDNGDYEEIEYFFNHDKTKLYVKQLDGTWEYRYDRN